MRALAWLVLALCFIIETASSKRILPKTFKVRRFARDEWLLGWTMRGGKEKVLPSFLLFDHMGVSWGLVLAFWNIFFIQPLCIASHR